MLLRPTADDARLVLQTLGRILAILAGVGVIPLGWAVALGEWDPAGSFLLMIGCFASLGFALQIARPSASMRLGWSHGMVVVALTWLVVPALGAVPFALSGHFGGWLDAYFDAMSGITTTGLATVQDLDHLASSINLWRHLLQFLGGQGIVLAMLSIFAGGGMMTLYYSEARDDRILPSVRSTARFIWGMSLLHGLVGVTALWLVGWLALGFSPGRSLFHGLTIFMAAFDTGGFSPQSTSLAYYRSALYEAVTAVFMVGGAMSFGLHYAMWRRRERARPGLEARTIATTFSASLIVALLGLVLLGQYVDLHGLVRRGLFQVLSAHTGTGFSTVSTPDLLRWDGVAFAAIATAMALGGMASSTAGGVKALRIGLTLRALAGQVRHTLLPRQAVTPEVYWHFGRRRLSPEVAQAVMAVSLLYVALYLLGAGVALGFGYPLQEALFESISAGANVGLSVGVTAPTMPTLLKSLYVLQMWAGRLEFVAVFSLIGFLLSWVVGE